MSELGIPANVKIYTSLIDACVQARGDEWTEVRPAWCAGLLCGFRWLQAAECVCAFMLQMTYVLICIRSNPATAAGL